MLSTPPPAPFSFPFLPLSSFNTWSFQSGISLEILEGKSGERNQKGTVKERVSRHNKAKQTNKQTKPKDSQWKVLECAWCTACTLGKSSLPADRLPPHTVLRMEARVSGVLGKISTTKLHPSPCAALGLPRL